MSDRSGRRVAFVQSQWHRDLVDRCRDSFSDAIGTCDVDYYEVPGALEIPLMAKRLIDTGRYDAIVAAGLIVNGGIYRHEFVASAVIDGLMRVQLDSGVPVLSAVLTPWNFHEHADHTDFFARHLVIKGREVAQACIGTLEAHARVTA